MLFLFSRLTFGFLSRPLFNVMAKVRWVRRGRRDQGVRRVDIQLGHMGLRMLGFVALVRQVVKLNTERTKKDGGPNDEKEIGKGEGD